MRPSSFNPGYAPHPRGYNPPAHHPPAHPSHHHGGAAVASIGAAVPFSYPMHPQVVSVPYMPQHRGIIIPAFKELQTPEFIEFITLLLEQMGLSKDDINILRENNAMDEFAKCFVTANKDPENNFELYELAGDVCINTAIVSYLHRILQTEIDVQLKKNPSFNPDYRLKDYFNKLKSKYISNQHFKTIALQLGFEKFIMYGADDLRILLTNPDEKFIASVLEAFFGCFEFVMSQFIKTKYSHAYVSSFISYIMHSLPINYNPDQIYDSVTLLKETSDQLRKFDKETKGSKIGFEFIIRQDQTHTMVDKVRVDQIVDPITEKITEKKTVLERIVYELGTSKEDKNKTALKALKKISTDRRLESIRGFIKVAPTAEELGIVNLLL
jgi:hypothetical protein